MSNISFFNQSFWNLFLQKIFRNFASIKFQVLLMLYIPTIIGMFYMEGAEGAPFVSHTLGFGLLGGGFVTLALGRIIARTKLTEDIDKDFDTDR